ncbi:ArsR/SmtB family transcription factor [Neobacillus ginsengisoli]|uniref:DNA-binding transcriptional ArsR family regulator n=1 Tax=Neobacillus ginsengisoli TaxID=904295 RepID=A0ABT9XV63_9BACI|nr:metalloregulator ArsR/SmtB family transcription factor [Neobacillus ginsengisoli]MDQ0199201.1 DNA-binding transcriptional ArsR family regulator [Neobacillus ginsengisoli]
MTINSEHIIFNHMVKYNDDKILNEVFSVLSDPTRREIINQLARGEMTVMKLAEPFEMSLPAISKHLKVLVKAGLISQRKEGRYRYYYLNPASVDYASQWLTDLRKYWASQLTCLEKYLNNNPKKE